MRQKKTPHVSDQVHHKNDSPIQQADVYLGSQLRFCLCFATDYETQMRLMNAHNAILYLMVPLLVHCLLLFQQVLDNKKTFQLPPFKRNRFILYGVQHLMIDRTSRFRSLICFRIAFLNTLAGFRFIFDTFKKSLRASL